MIYYFKPYSTEGRLGRAYNQYMNLLSNDDDWAVLLDGDTMFLTSDFGDIIQGSIDANPGYDILTSYVSRTKQKHLMHSMEYFYNYDIRTHYDVAVKMREENYPSIKPIKNIIVGYMIMLQKKTWKEIGEFKDKDILTVDVNYAKRALKLNKKIGIIEGIYLLHLYRMGGIKSKDFLTQMSNRER